MNKSKLSIVLFSIAMLFTISMISTSCEQKEAIIDQLEEQVDNPIAEEELAHLVPTEREENYERIPECWCKYRSASRRTSSSSYVYCYGYTGIDKTYYLEDMYGNSKGSKFSPFYNVYFTGLNAGQKYRYRTLTNCPKKPVFSPWTTFTQAH